jgi:hypothetical protein
MHHDSDVDSAADLPALPSLFRADAFGTDSRETRRLSRGAARGALVVVHPGVYARASEWAAAGERDRHRLRVRGAAGSLSSRLVVSHGSAALMHGLRVLGSSPDRVHVTDPARSHSQAWSHVMKHAGPLDEEDVERVDGILVTSLARTLVDVALTQGFAEAVVTIDSGLRRPGVTRDDLLGRLARRAARARTSARRAIEFASPLSDSGGESWCRCRLAELGAPVPLLQHVFHDGLGAVGPVDFWFSDAGVVVEFDGDMKYLDERYSGGLSASEIVLKERRRERRLLALPEVREVVRADWRDLVEGWRLRRLIVAAGVPVR